MGFQDRRYRDGDGGFRRALTRADGFFSWSFPLFTVPRWVPALEGIHVRVHILYILVAAGELLRALSHDALGLRYAGAMMSTLFVLVILHEFGHCLACRAVGGDADEVLIWPLGGLAYCRPPHRWKAALVTTLGGPGVNVLLVPILGSLLVAAGAQWNDLLFNPLRPERVVGHIFFLDAWRAWLWAAYYMNLVLLLFNMSLPMYPMDCGRVLQELLWARIGYRRSMEIAVNVGLFGAVALGLFGLVTSEMRMVALALFGGTTCYNERQRIRYMEEAPASLYDTDKGFGAFDRSKREPSWSERRAAKSALKRQTLAREHEARVDRILDKIAERGLQSLSEREQAILRAATDAQNRAGVSKDRH